jgi:hypothetical protein
MEPSTSSKGALRFEPGSADAMPDVVVALSGTTIDDNGQVRELDARASTRYRFNAQESRYDAVQ